MVWPLKRISLVRRCVLTLHVFEPNSNVLFSLSICRILNLIFKMGIGLTCKAKKNCFYWIYTIISSTSIKVFCLIELNP